jgi:hypothetical protein
MWLLCLFARRERGGCKMYCQSCQDLGKSECKRSCTLNFFTWWISFKRGVWNRLHCPHDVLVSWSRHCLNWSSPFSVKDTFCMRVLSHSKSRPNTT